MADHRDNVVVLPERGRSAGMQPSRPEVLRAVVEQLDELSRCLQQLSPHPTWSAQRWMIASTPFRMRLVGARKRLAELTTSWPVSDQVDSYWLLELKDVSLEGERRIHDIDMCLQTLQHADTPLSARARENEIFASGRSDLVQVAERVRGLFHQRFPESLPKR